MNNWKEIENEFRDDGGFWQPINIRRMAEEIARLRAEKGVWGNEFSAVCAIKEKLIDVKRDRDKLASRLSYQVEATNQSNLLFLASEAREIALRAELQRTCLHSCAECHQRVSQALAAQDPPPILGAINRLVKVCQEIVDDHEDPQFALEKLPEALTSLRAAIGDAK